MKRLGTLVLTMLFSAQTFAADKVELLLDWYLNPDHGPIIVAQQQGYFAEQGLEVNIVEPADPSMPPKLVAAGKADMAISYQPQLHQQIDEGLPLLRVGTLVNTPLNSLVVLKDDPVKSIADLKGRTVGYSVSGFEDTLLRAMLEKHGLSLDDIELVNINWSLSPSLISGQVGAVIGAFRNFELNQMDIEGHPGRAFLVEEEGVPAYDELIMVIHSQDRDDERFPHFNRAIEKATRFISEHPTEAWKSFTEYRPHVLGNELYRRAWNDTLPHFAPHPSELDRQRYRAFGEFMVKQGLTRSNPPVDSYAIER